ncbi:MAG: MarR family winged helix-turn-helix transcriptional regulator, partial [Rhizobacter sp.]
GYQVAQASIATLSIFHRTVGDAMELRPAEFTLLVLIRENPGGTAARFARALAVTAPNVTLWLDKLERRGLVKRATSETDRRTLHLQVTDKGRRVADEATQRIIEAERETFGHLSPGERAILVELLHKVAMRSGQ